MRLVVAVVLALVLAGCSSAGQDQAERKGQTGFVAGDGQLTVFPAADREPAPQLSGDTLDGKTWSLADQAGKVVVLNVWASWCQPCRKEAPDLETAAERLGRDVVFVGLNTRDPDPNPARRFVERFKVSYPSITDPQGLKLLGFRGKIAAAAIPSTLVIDAEGRVAARVLGPVTAATLVDVVEDVSG